MRAAHGTALLLALVASAVGAAPPGESIRVPSGPVVPTPMPAPPGPDAAVRLDRDTLFVIDADNPVLVLASPKGVVRVTEEAGPLKIRGKFVDGPGQTETRTFKGKAVFVVEAAVTGRCEILVVPAGAKADQVIRRTLQVEAGEGPQPPPKPDPKVDPKPDPKVEPKDDAPIPAPGLRVLIVYDGAEAAVAKLSPGHQEIIFGAPFREYLQAHCAKGPDGKTAEYRIWKATTAADSDNRLWATAFARKRDSLPWLVVSNGVGGFEGPLPKDAAEAKELVGRYTK